MSKNAHKALIIFSLIYLSVVSFFMVKHGNWFSPDQFFAVALIITLFLGRFKQFIRDWSFPIILFLSYDYLRGLVPNLSLTAHIQPMIDFDRVIFGSIPTNTLQALLFSDKTIRWYDNVSTILYMSHFIVPMIVGFIFWLISREYFKEYFLALLLLSYAGFLTYVLFPAVPPWMAAQQGYIPGVQKIMDQVFASFITPVNLPSVYKFVGANTVAAVPSLHAAYPWLTFLFFIKKFQLKGLLLTPYVLSIWFVIVYLGEHYVFDIVIGVIYATIAFFLVRKRSYFRQKAFAFLTLKFYRKEAAS